MNAHDVELLLLVLMSIGRLAIIGQYVYVFKLLQRIGTLQSKIVFTLAFIGYLCYVSINTLNHNSHQVEDVFRVWIGAIMLHIILRYLRSK